MVVRDSDFRILQHSGGSSCRSFTLLSRANQFRPVWQTRSNLKTVPNISLEKWEINKWSRIKENLKWYSEDRGRAGQAMGIAWINGIYFRTPLSPVPNFMFKVMSLTADCLYLDLQLSHLLNLNYYFNINGSGYMELDNIPVILHCNR